MKAKYTLTIRDGAREVIGTHAFEARTVGEALAYAQGFATKRGALEYTLSTVSRLSGVTRAYTCSKDEQGRWRQHEQI